jgi:FkbM family methyltransferase
MIGGGMTRLPAEGRFPCGLVSTGRAVLGKAMIKDRPRATYIGGGRVLTELNSGEAIVVDAESLHALGYLMGWDMDRDIVAALSPLLKADSVFVDVGAHVGSFTLRAATKLAARGRIFSFEANPKMYWLLQRSLYVNHWFGHPNIALVNCAVHDAPGKMDFWYSDLATGGGSLWRTSNLADKCVSVECGRLDDLIPADVVVDVVKIDVEGNEPYVLKGMHAIIARSPTIKIVVEFFERFLDKSYGGALRFQEDIAALGLRMWRIGPAGALEEHDLRVPLTGESNCLLSRSPA